MKKTILVTGATDGIGLETVKSLAKLGHRVLIHGRNQAKLEKTRQLVAQISNPNNVEAYKADLSVMAEVKALVTDIRKHHSRLDGLINNAGVFVVSETVTADGLDVRFAVNTIAPYILTKGLLPLLDASGRVINVSSAAQSPVVPDALSRPSFLSNSSVYAQSKLALTMWSKQLADELGPQGPVIVAVNPASFLGSKMVKQAYGIAGGDLQKGADIFVRAFLSDEFANASGLYFDNDHGEFADPHPDALNSTKTAALTDKLAEITARFHL